MSARRQQDLLGPLLRGVSRSFYLTLKVLPPGVRPQISVAYLLARASDSIADTAGMSLEQRLCLLRNMQQNNFHQAETAAAAVVHPAESELLRRISECVVLRDSFLPADQALIRNVHRTILEGQIFDLERFKVQGEDSVTALSSNEELDRYIYLVAGCVGEFWTRMCVAHLSDLKGWDLSRMVDLGVRFGKGLQLVNILRDLPRDLRNGRCYLPVAEPRCLLKAEAFTSFSVEYARWLDLAISYLESGWEYVLSIPASQWRLRLACVWPIWIGLMTIASLRQANPLDGAARIKIERRQVYGVIVRSLLTGKSHAALTRHYRMLLNKARGTQSG